MGTGSREPTGEPGSPVGPRKHQIAALHDFITIWMSSSAAEGTFASAE